MKLILISLTLELYAITSLGSNAFATPHVGYHQFKQIEICSGKWPYKQSKKRPGVRVSFSTPHRIHGPWLSSQFFLPFHECINVPLYIQPETIVKKSSPPYTMNVKVRYAKNTKFKFYLTKASSGLPRITIDYLDDVYIGNGTFAFGYPSIHSYGFSN